jgi:hypothetical protein
MIDGRDEKAHAFAKSIVQVTSEAIPQFTQNPMQL